MKLRELRAVLRQCGFVASQNGGSHQVWTNPYQPGCNIVLAGQDGKEAHKYQVKRVRSVCLTSCNDQILTSLGNMLHAKLHMFHHSGYIVQEVLDALSPSCYTTLDKKDMHVLLFS